MKIRNMKVLVVLLGIGSILSVLSGQGEPLKYYLPDYAYNPSIPTPKEYFGFEIGEWHLEPQQVQAYLFSLAVKSERLEYYEYARSHENRPLFVIMISHPDNISNKDNIKRQHTEMIFSPEKYKKMPEGLPAILYQGYTIHGNEPSGMNASVLVAYCLAAAEHPEIDEFLSNLFIILDPCLNPDGSSRFATWVNSHKNRTLVSDPADREFNEVWPGGRYNHYWFDLNRDWLTLVQPESKGRVKLFQEWRPNVLTDHHEMGTNSTFFFQPGIPSSNNPYTPADNIKLTEEMGLFHAAALDSIGSRYFTKASFDDFYYGKGSTYPDAQGAVGILFEQASSRGHIQESVNGPLAFSFTIRNQVVTSFSTYRAISTMKDKLLEYKRDFLNTAYRNLGNKADKYFIFTHEDDYILSSFLSLLDQHRIDVYKTDKTFKSGSEIYPEKRSFIVPVRQNQPVLALTMFEQVKNFRDSSFYDVSGWTPAAAYNLKYTEFSGNIPSDKYRYNVKDFLQVGLTGNADNAYGYLIDIRQHSVYNILYALQKKGIAVYTIHAEMEIEIKGQKRVFAPGSLFISAIQKNMNPLDLHQIIELFSKQYNLEVHTVYSGNKTESITAGHPKVIITEIPKAAVLTGRGIAPQSAGEVWHHADQNLQMEITKLDIERLAQARLQRYNTLIMPDGSYSFSDSEINKIREWLRSGNRLICIGRAVQWAVNQKLINLQEKKTNSADTMSEIYEYEQLGIRSSARILGGAIIKAETDISHPLFFGYTSKSIPLMHSGTRFYETTELKVATPARYAKDYLVSGYIPRHISGLIAGSSVVSVHNSGGGKVIAMQDNPLFRGYWLAGQRLFNNALFLSSGIDNNSMQGE